MSEPVAERPYMPGYKLAPASEGLLPWSWARERLERTRNYWVCTTRPDGRPHAAAVWGVWLDGAFVFSTATGSRKARNLASNAACVVCTEDAEEAVSLEGTAAPVDAGTLASFKRVYKEKYDWNMSDTEEGIYAVRPRTLFGFIEHANQFAKTATRWTFGEDER